MITLVCLSDTVLLPHKHVWVNGDGEMTQSVVETKWDSQYLVESYGHALLGFETD